MPRRPASSGRSSAARWPFWRSLWALGVLALLLSDVWRVPHLLMVRHQVCGEHGELVHEHDAGDTTQAQPLELAVDSGSPVAHHHDHCGAVTAPGKRAAVVAASAAAIHLGAAPGPTLLGPPLDSAPDARRVLAYAPKQSPPA